MDNRLVLLVEMEADECATAIGKQILAAGLQCKSVGEGEAVARLQQMIAHGADPVVVVIGPAVLHALSLARRIRAVWTTGQILFIQLGEQSQKLHRELQRAPMIGPNWSLVNADDPGLSEKIQRAVHTTRQRVRLQTTLDRANVRLSAPKPVDSVQYRRSVLSEHYLATLLQQSQDIILSLDTRDTILYWSSGAERLFQQSAGEAFGRPVRELPFWSDEMQVGLEKIFAGERTLMVETTCSLAQGQTHLEIHFSRVHDDAGAYIGTSLALVDTSRRHQILEAERAARVEAERMSRMKDEFLAILSHELRTPLSAVIGRTQLLQMRYRDQPELLSALDVIERNAQLQATLIEDLLDISAIITGKLHLNMQPVVVQQLVDAAVESIRPVAHRKRIALLEQGSVGTALVQAEPHRLQQVFYNLLSNAVKFTPEGGRVIVCKARKGTWMEITIADNGIGISAEFMPLVFERFGQEDASITRRHGGLGLGLSIARQLVERHGGHIRAESAGRDCGASFTVSLPVSGEQEDQDVPTVTGVRKTEADSPARLSSHRILVVEDVADARQLVTEVLQAHGAQVTAVESGAAALQVLDTVHPHVIVSDIGMPDMDGYELLQRVRSRGHTGEKLPAVALTAFVGPGDKDRALLAGFQAHVPKPLIVTELVNAVARLADEAFAIGNKPSPD